MLATEQGDFRDAALNALFGSREAGDTRTLYKRNGETFEIQYPVFAEFLVNHPEVAMLMVSNYECAMDPRTGEPVRSEYCSTQNRLKFSTDDDAEALLAEGMNSNPPWFEVRENMDKGGEASWRIASARQDLLRYAWSSLTNRERFDPGSRLSPEFLGEIVSLGSRPELQEMMWAVGMFNGARPDTVTGAELAAEFSRVNDLTQITSPWVSDPTFTSEFKGADPRAESFMHHLDRLQKTYDELGLSHPSDWDEETQQAIRDEGTLLIKRIPWFTEEHWNKHFARAYGPLDWEDIAPPTLMGGADEFESVLHIDDLTDIEVQDGDTIHLLMADGSKIPFRFIGINAPDLPMEGSQEATDDLIRLLKDEGREVDLVIWRPEVYGTEAGRDSKTLEARVKVWLYVDGYPIFFQDTFTHSNPLGLGSGDPWPIDPETGELVRPLPRPPVEGEKT